MFKLVTIFALFILSFFVYADTDRELVAIITWNYPTSTFQTTSEDLAAQTKLRDLLNGTTYTGSISSTRSIGTIYFPGYTLSNGYFYVEGYWSFNKLFPSGREYTDNLDTIFFLGADTYYVQGAPLAVMDYSLSGSCWWKTTNIKIGNIPQSFTFQIGIREFGYDWSTEEGVYYGASCWGTAYIWRLKNAVSLDYTTPNAGDGWSTPILPSGSTGQPFLGENNPTGTPDVPSVEGGGGGTTDPDNPGGDTGGGDTGGGDTGGGDTGGGDTGGGDTGGGDTGGGDTGGDDDDDDDETPKLYPPSPPAEPPIKINPEYQKVNNHFNSLQINTTSGGSFNYPSFNIPLPSGATASINLGNIHSSVVGPFNNIKAFVRALCYALVTVIFFFKVFKLFRKNS